MEGDAENREVLAETTVFFYFKDMPDHRSGARNAGRPLPGNIGHRSPASRSFDRFGNRTNSLLSQWHVGVRLAGQTK
jgi:hypothetical protein